jgi:hypothetical protein
MLATSTAAANAFDATEKNVCDKNGIAPWTLSTDKGMRDLQNILVLALETTLLMRDKHNGGSGSVDPHFSGSSWIRRRRLLDRPPNRDAEDVPPHLLLTCDCPAPEHMNRHKPFWSPACSKAARALNKSRNAANKAKKRLAPQSARISPRSRIHIQKLCEDVKRANRTFRRVLTDAKRRYWGIVEGRLSRFTSYKEVQAVVRLLGSGMQKKLGKSGNHASDSLANTIAKRGGLTSNRQDPSATISGGMEAADFLTAHFADTTRPRSTSSALDDVHKIEVRRASEGRKQISPSLSERTTRALSAVEEWHSKQSAPGQLLAQIPAQLAEPLPGPASNLPGKRFTTAEVMACKVRKKGKSTWHDGVSDSIVASACSRWDECFAVMMSMAALTGEYPLWWKNPRMRHLLKSKANTYSTAIDPKHTRPLSIGHPMAKLGEALLTSRLVYITESEDKGTALGKKQFGFRPKRGCLDNLLSHVQAVKQAWRKGWFTVEICRDAVKAFDKVHHATVLHKLCHKHNINGPLLRLTAGFLRHRQAHTVLGDDMGHTLDLYGGVPQGAVASPCLYAVDADEQTTLCDGLTSPLFGSPIGTASVAYYADDSRIWVLLPGPDATDITHPSGSWQQECSQRLRNFQDLLDESSVLAAMSRQAFSDDPKKLQSTVYLPDAWTTPKKDQIIAALEQSPLFMLDQQFEIGTNTIVALGLQLDSGLTFNEHILSKVAMAHRRVDTLESLKSEPWFTDTHTMIKRIYSPWIASLWEHASPCWGTAGPALLQKIDAVERRALQACFGLKRTEQGVSRLALLRESGIHSAQQRRLINAAVTWHKVNGSAPDSSHGRMLSLWKTESPDWRQEVQEAKGLCAWIDIQTCNVSCTSKRADERRALVTPLAYCAAAAMTLQMTLEQVGSVERHGLEHSSMRCCPYLEDPCDGITPAPEMLEQRVTTESLQLESFDTLFPRGSEGFTYELPIVGAAGKRTHHQKSLANAYAAALAEAFMAKAKQHRSNVVCSTDGASIFQFGPSVLEPTPQEAEHLWTRNGGGSGAVIATADNTPLAMFGTTHGRVSDSAADEMAGLHSVLMALVSAYIPECIDILDPSGRSASASRHLVWETPSGSPPRDRLSIAPGKTTIIIACDNQGVVQAARTESLCSQPLRGASAARTPGHAIHREIVMAKRTLTARGASVQIIWMPGHTDESDWLNYTADLLADKAAIVAAYTGNGSHALPMSLRMLKNHLKRYADVVLRNSWFHLFKDAAGRNNKAVGHDYLVNMVLWQGPTVDHLLDKSIQQELARTRDRWLAVPVEITLCSLSYQATKAVTRLRLNMRTRNVILARKYNAPATCPWCLTRPDSAKHRLIHCSKVATDRLAFADQLRAATLGSDPNIPDTRTNDNIISTFFTFDLLIKGLYHDSPLPDLERYTAPPPHTRKAFAEVGQRFLRKVNFYRRVFSDQADIHPDVKLAITIRTAIERSLANLNTGPNGLLDPHNRPSAPPRLDAAAVAFAPGRQSHPLSSPSPAAPAALEPTSDLPPELGDDEANWSECSSSDPEHEDLHLGPPPTQRRAGRRSTSTALRPRTNSR